jgi:WD40 repeat protein
LFSLMKHRGVVHQAEWSTDGRMIATASEDKTAKIFDAQSGRLVFTLAHRDKLVRVSWTPDGKRLVTAGRDGTADIWDSETGQRLLTLEHEGPLSFALWNADGTRLVTAGLRSGYSKVWSTASFPDVLSMSDGVTDIAWNHESTRIAATGFNSVHVWDWSTSGHTKLRDDTVSLTTGLEWTRDGRTLLVQSLAKALTIDLFTGHQEERSFPNPRADAATSPDVTLASWSPDRGKLLSCSTFLVEFREHSVHR